MANLFKTFFLVSLLSLGCQKTNQQDFNISLEQARELFTKEPWKPVSCIGIPEKVTAFTITKYDEGTRIDLNSEGNVHVIYKEFINDAKGQTFSPELYQIEGITEPVFIFDSPYYSRTRSNYIQLVGFVDNRMIRISAWQNMNASQNEFEVSMEIAKLAIKTIRAK